MKNSSILGAGASGSVRTCRCKSTNIIYALKTLLKNSFESSKLDVIRQEISMMAKLDHPNILRIKEFFETKKEVIYKY
jgi:serine/threonine protein kinase